MNKNIIPEKDNIVEKILPFNIKEDTDNIYILDYIIPKSNTFDEVLMPLKSIGMDQKKTLKISADIKK